MKHSQIKAHRDRPHSLTAMRIIAWLTTIASLAAIIVAALRLLAREGVIQEGVPALVETAAGRDLTALIPLGVLGLLVAVLLFGFASNLELLHEIRLHMRDANPEYQVPKAKAGSGQSKPVEPKL